MSAVIAGAASGMVMAVVFVPVGAMILFSMAKEPSPRFRALLGKHSPMKLVMPAVVLAYPVWGAIGAVMGLLYNVSEEAAPRGGIGSSNLAFTLAVVIGAALFAVPLWALFRRMKIGLAVMGLAFAGVFGWFLPLFAS